MRAVGTLLCSLGLAGSMLASPVSAHAPEDPKVALAEGRIAGVREGGVDAFLGIPFAAPPTGENRWRAPQPIEPWQETRHAQTFGANCIQPLDQGNFGPWTHEYVVTENFSEDCLFLNVWRPRDAAPDAKLPVLVWVHGGAFVAGSGSVPIYDGRNLASRDMIVVTINYRLGPLGFLALPELSEEAGDGAKANFGIQDQIAALQWVQRNIASFGGDRSNVTVAGQSAGAVSMHTLVASPLAQGLFARAIAQAGLPVPGKTSTPLAEAEEMGEQYARQLGAANLAELRALPPERFLPQPGVRSAFRFGVVVDGVLLETDQRVAVLEGRANDVPMLIGQNADEVLGPPPAGETTSQEEWDSKLAAMFGNHADTIGSLYPSSSDEERSASLWQIHRDRAFADIWLWGTERAKNNNGALYVYQFDHVEPGPLAAQWRAFHSSELPYFFGTLGASPERPFTFEDWRVSLTASQIWANFAKTGRPGTSELGQLPAFEADGPLRTRIADRAFAEALLPPEKREAYAAFAADGGQLSAMFR